jgi:hypothetical protein
MNLINLKQVDTSALREELDRRQREEEKRREEFNTHRRELQKTVLTEQVIAALAPEHERTSCSDDELMNGWGSHSSGGARCLRCALLEGVSEGYHFELKIERD